MMGPHRLRRVWIRRPRPVRAIKVWRWRRAAARRIEGQGGYRSQLQMCPHGCGFRELGRRELVTRTRLWGRAVLRLRFEFQTTNCPDCGARLARSCARCHQPLLAPMSERCESCGVPFPWSAIRASRPGALERRGWRPGEKDVNVGAVPVYHSTGGTVWVVEGDIVRIAVDAIVSNDDVDGKMWTEVARAIKLAAGEDVERQASVGAPFEQGHAWITRTGAMHWVSAIIHVAAMNRRGESDMDKIKNCLRKAFSLARKERLASVGLAAIGSGPFALPSGEWFEMFAGVVVEAVTMPPGGARPHHLDIVLVLFETDNVASDVATLERAVSQAWRGCGKPSYGHPPIILRRHFMRRKVVRIDLLPLIEADQATAAEPLVPVSES
jgi:O-acetyl-ADP-ribose deacetylase (regulator of RNase III)